MEEYDTQDPYFIIYSLFKQIEEHNKKEHPARSVVNYYITLMGVSGLAGAAAANLGFTIPYNGPVVAGDDTVGDEDVDFYEKLLSLLQLELQELQQSPRFTVSQMMAMLPGEFAEISSTDYRKRTDYLLTV